MDNFGDRLKLLRKLLGEMRGKKKLTQDEMAEIVGVDKQTWWRYEQNKRQPDVLFVQDLIRKVGLNPLWFLAGRGDVLLGKDWIFAESSAPYVAHENDYTEKVLSFIKGNKEFGKFCAEVILILEHLSNKPLERKAFFDMMLGYKSRIYKET